MEIFWTIIAIAFFRGALKAHKQHKAALALKTHRNWWN